MRLSRSLSQLKPYYQVVVIGSGYGAGVAASRLARAGRRVCVLERGREFRAGDFPNTLAAAAGEFQVDLPEGRFGSRTGLYDLRVNADMNVMLGCGLGGTSLLNASVALRAEPRVFDDPCWPQALRDEVRRDDSLLAQGFAHAERMLRPQPYPEGRPPPAKLEAHRRSAQGLGQPFYRPPINVNFAGGTNHVGVEQNACIDCGDCVSGCNHAAKNTVDLNYLPDAANHGAEIFTEVQVSHIARAEAGEGSWLVYFRPLALGREHFDAPDLFLRADIVVLGAGSLGSTEVLLRSGAAGLALSSQLGRRFSGNGDVLAFAYNCDVPINGVGFGDHAAARREPVGPCITSVIDTRAALDVETGLVIEEGSLPGALAPLLPVALSSVADLTGRDTDTGFLDALSERARALDSGMRGAYHGAVHNTQTFLVMAHDGSGGELYLDDDRLRVRWPGVGDEPRFRQIAERLDAAAQALGGTYVPNPIWNRLLGHDLISVHPLGGCAMADSAGQGVVNDRCQVFAGATGTAVHPGLYVTDGAVMPRSLGVNPLLTITAIAERACQLLARDNGWDLPWTETSVPVLPAPTSRLGIAFTETMRGHFAANPDLDYAAAEAAGRQSGSTLAFTVSMISDDLDSLLDTESHTAMLLGTVSAPTLAAGPLSALGGSFQLLVRDPDSVGVRRMVYRLPLQAASGERFLLTGYKRVQDQRGFDIWDDTTTLYVSLYRGADEQAPLIGRGVLHIAAEDFARQMTTLRALNAADARQAAAAVLRFGRHFAGVLAQTYAKGVAPLQVFNPDAPPRKRRPLRAGVAEIVPFTTADGVALRLTRHRGGDKGPVLLAHGLGVSSRIFSIDTIDTNLLEYLYGHGYDVWLLDFRVSIDLPAARCRSDGDVIAREDFPAAVATVRAQTGAATIQVVAHCFGAGIFTMALLAGLQGVRSAVLSQVGAHYVPPLLSRLKAGMFLPELLDTLGVESLTAYRDMHADWENRLYDQLLRLYPQPAEDRTDSAIDHRITFMYGQLWELDQLNTATFDALHELFGVANIAAFDHLATILRAGHAVSARGEEIYLPYAHRMALPLRFIHGAENRTFLPRSTALTLDWLREANGHNLYDRVVVPGYGHIDCIFGRNAVRDVYPHILDHLERTG